MKKCTFTSKIGNITIFDEENFIVKISIGHNLVYNDEPSDIITNAFHQIQEYLKGKRTEFDIPYKVNSSSFENDVFKAMRQILYGETVSYKELATRSGHPNAYRAVGTVCKSNKLPLIFPCHRVIKANGDIGEYAFGRSIKKELLSIENSYKID